MITLNLKQIDNILYNKHPSYLYNSYEKLIEDNLHKLTFNDHDGILYEVIYSRPTEKFIVNKVIR